jgi:hypothetical protein
MPTILEKPEAVELTTPYHEVWEAAHRHAWRLWHDRLLDDPTFFKPLTSADRYALIHRHICDYVGRHLEGRASFAPSLDFFAQIIDNRALVRFKHVDDDFRPRNYRTDQQQHLDRQQFTDRVAEQLILDGFAPTMTVLTVGFTLTPGEEDLSQISVICRNPKLLYSYSLLETGEGFGDGGVDVQPFPRMDPPGPRVVSRRPAQSTETDIQ